MQKWSETFQFDGREGVDCLWASSDSPKLMSKVLLVRFLAVAAFAVYVGGLVKTCYRFRPSTQNFTASQEVVGQFRLEGSAKHPGGSIDGKSINFDVGAFGASGGGRARLIPNGARVTASIVKVRTDQGVLPWIVRVESGGTVVFDLTPEERRQEWLDATEFIAVMESVLAFIPALLIFGSVRRRASA